MEPRKAGGIRSNRPERRQPPRVDLADELDGICGAGELPRLERFSIDRDLVLLALPRDGCRHSSPPVPPASGRRRWLVREPPEKRQASGQQPILYNWLRGKAFPQPSRRAQDEKWHGDDART